MESELETLKATQIPQETLLNHLRLDAEFASAEDKAMARACYEAALSFFRERCAVDEEYMDAHPEIAVAVLILARDMYDNRTLYVDTSNVNEAFEAIVSLHDGNLL